MTMRIARLNFIIQTMNEKFCPLVSAHLSTGSNGFLLGSIMPTNALTPATLYIPTARRAVNCMMGFSSHNIVSFLNLRNGTKPPMSLYGIHRLIALTRNPKSKGFSALLPCVESTAISQCNVRHINKYEIILTILHKKFLLSSKFWITSKKHLDNRLEAIAQKCSVRQTKKSPLYPTCQKCGKLITVVPCGIITFGRFEYYLLHLRIFSGFWVTHEFCRVAFQLIKWDCYYIRQEVRVWRRSDKE